MKRKTVQKIVWIIISVMVIFSMVIWTIGIALI
ncbi:MAG: hypothetical protein BWY51_00476 [Parcubacteria group bacterium ADurb.Bin316]|nr:MAG: hypothetical protein BWY51_00476 [Parcubacteria group bacterium ADurb.Bin316]